MLNNIAIVQTYVRKPKPSCNWCPRKTFVTIIDRFGKLSYAVIPDGYNMRQDSLRAWLIDFYGKDCHDTTWDIVQNREIEVTIGEFRYLNKGEAV